MAEGRVIDAVTMDRLGLDIEHAGTLHHNHDTIDIAIAVMYFEQNAA